MTALMVAAEKGHLEVLSLLFQNGADIHMENEVCQYVTRFVKIDHIWGKSVLKSVHIHIVDRLLSPNY